MTFRNKLIMGFGAALYILLLIGALSYQRFLQEDSDQKWVAHTREVLEELHTALAASTQLNDDEHPFLTNPGSTYPESAQRGASELQSHIARIKILTADNPKQQAAQARLAELANARISLAAALGSQSDETATLEEKQRQLMTEIRNVFLEMRSEEKRRLRARLQRATDRARQMAITAYSIFREIEKRQHTEERLLRAQEQYRPLFDGNPILAGGRQCGR